MSSPNHPAMTFADRLIDEIRARRSPCIVGIDPALEHMPADFLRERGIGDESTREERARALFEYSASIVDAVHDLVAAVKPQSAYFERYGAPGIAALEQTVEYARRKGLLILLDAKRGDIGSMAAAYAAAYLDPGGLEVDAMTLSPYLGSDTLEPFFTACETHGKGAFVCVKTSNPGAGSLQDLDVGGRLVCEVVADMLEPFSRRTAGRHGYGLIGAVVGATYPETARALRSRLPRSIFLVPGIGAQGGDSTALRAYFNADGLGAIVSSSRAVNYPHLYGGESIRTAALRFIEQVRGAV
jgi:orotidine-5'-phosphate decarboxylase